jgi:hypothetical protein
MYPNWQTKDYVRMAVTRRYNQGYRWTSTPVLETIVRELMERDGRDISKNLSKHIRDALTKRCLDSPTLIDRELWFQHNDQGEWGMCIGPGGTLEEFFS